MRATVAVSVGLALAASDAHAAGGGGLVLIPDGALLLGLLVVFALLVFPMNRLIFQPIFRVLDDREERIAGTRSRAERLQREAEEIVARYERAVSDAGDEAEQERRERLEVARRESTSETAGARSAAEREIEAARASMAEALEQARTALRSETRGLARQAAERVLGRQLS